MLYYSKEARLSAIQNINKCIEAILNVEDQLEFQVALDTVGHLSDMRKVLETEDVESLRGE